MLVNDLFEDIKDGVMLIALLEVLSGQKLVRTSFLMNIQDCYVTSLGYNFLNVSIFEYCKKRDCLNKFIHRVGYLVTKQTNKILLQTDIMILCVFY